MLFSHAGIGCAIGIFQSNVGFLQWQFSKSINTLIGLFLDISRFKISLLYRFFVYPFLFIFGEGLERIVCESVEYNAILRLFMWDVYIPR